MGKVFKWDTPIFKMTIKGDYYKSDIVTNYYYRDGYIVSYCDGRLLDTYDPLLFIDSLIRRYHQVEYFDSDMLDHLNSVRSMISRDIKVKSIIDGY